MKKLITSLLLIYSASGYAVETWVCGLTAPEQGDSVVAVINDDGKSGTIKVAGTTHKTVYSVEGFDRNWYFGYDKKARSYRYVFTIQPTDLGLFYDFHYADKDGLAKPRYSHFCTKKQFKAPSSALPSTSQESSTRTPDLSELSSGEKSSIESVCLTAKLQQGPVAYNQCLNKHLDSLKRK